MSPRQGDMKSIFFCLAQRDVEPDFIGHLSSPSEAVILLCFMLWSGAASLLYVVVWVIGR